MTGKRYFGTENGLRKLEDGRLQVSGLIADWVFGPVDSRRLGRSLGINPFPLGDKICSFNCPYCECGWTNLLKVGKHPDLSWPLIEDISQQLEEHLLRLKKGGDELQAITFAGNGEPTLHPDFPDLVDEVRRLRNQYQPKAKLAVLTNASELHRAEIRACLLSVDLACMKLDAGSAGGFYRINKPHPTLSLESIVEQIASFPSPVIQSIFVHGPADNTGEEEIRHWLENLKKIKPSQVDIYTLDRKPPDKRLERLSRQELEDIASRVRAEIGCQATVY